MTYENWLNEWLNNYVKHTAKFRTYERYRQLITAHIARSVGKYELEELTPAVLQSFVTKLLEHGNIRTKKGLSSNTVNCVISVIQSSLKTSSMLGYMSEYIGGKIMRPKITEKQVSCFTVQEQKKIEKRVSESVKPKLKGIVVCLYTGLRIGELLALTWKDVDFVRNTITVSKTCYDKRINGKTEKVTEAPKTNTSNRVIPFPKQLISVLKELKKSSASEYVISDKGKTISVRSYQRSFELLLKRLNIPHKGFHALRHTFATRALECGMDVKTLAEVLGHGDPTVTLKRYAHSLTEHKRDMMNKLGKLLQ